MRAIDPHHMVTVGEEGFYSSTCERVHLNPGAGKRRIGIASSPWALEEGQDFMAQHASPDISFATTHGAQWAADAKAAPGRTCSNALSTPSVPPTAWPDNWLGFADFSPPNSNQAFDYQFGNAVWREKLAYLQAWLQAHIEDAATLGKPCVSLPCGNRRNSHTSSLPCMQAHH